jgi:hypothetical protein
VRNIIGIEYESISMCGELVGDCGDGFGELASFSVLGGIMLDLSCYFIRN